MFMVGAKNDIAFGLYKLISTSKDTNFDVLTMYHLDLLLGLLLALSLYYFSIESDLTSQQYHHL